MSKLIKERVKSITSGSAGQLYVPEQLGHEGYWSTTQVVKVGCIPSPNAKVISVQGWRVSTYDEIANFLYTGSDKSNKCAILKKQMETLYNTPFLFKSVGYIDKNSFLAVAYPPGSNGLGLAICTVDKNATDWEIVPTPRDIQFYWNFDDYYNCEIINGVEVLTPI